MTSWDLVAIGAIIFIGVPHGGLDGAVARRIGCPNGMMAWIGFNLSYVLLAALVAWAWLQWPLLGLSGFLFISALHFGASDIANTRSSMMEKSFLRWLPLISHGGLVSIAIPNFQASSVQSLFTLLVGNTGAAILINTLSLFLLPWLLCVTAYLGYAFIYPVWRKPMISIVLLLMLVWWLPPLISFAVYFCLCHSRNHLLRVWLSIKEERERRRSFIEAMAYSVLAWASVLVFIFIVPNTFTEALVQITFIGLAALTVPHMLLVDLANKLNQ